MKTLTDSEARLFLAKCLPEKIEQQKRSSDTIYWKELVDGDLQPVKDTELLHICWLVEQTLSINQHSYYKSVLWEQVRFNPYPDDNAISASWQQRATALHKVLGKEEV